MKEYKICFLGFGNVGHALLRLLVEKKPELRMRYGIEWRLTGVSTRRAGSIARLKGLLPEALLADEEDVSTMRIPTLLTLSEWLAAAQADVLFEVTSLNPLTGQPAIDHVRAGLEVGAHVITANKGPVVHAYRELRDLAAARGRRFMFEAMVMGGAPIFSLFRETLPASNLLRFRGLLNSTTNLILTEIESGRSFEEAVKKAQDIGLAETDPSHDVDGWDAAVKLSALATVLMDSPTKPQEVERRGIRDLNVDAVREARASGHPYKAVCRLERKDGRVVASVRPEQVPLDDPLASIRGASSIAHFEVDTLPDGLTLISHNPGPATTAYDMLADFVNVARGR